MSFLQSCIRAIILILFPAWCQECGRFGTWICKRCWSHILFAEPSENRPASVFPSLKRIWSLAEYDPHLGKFLQALKYRQARVLAKPFGQALARQASTFLCGWKVEALIPVPLHLKRYQQRGYNQTGLLAQVLSDHSNIPVDWLALERSTWSKTQAKQNRDDRQQIQHAFRAKRRLKYNSVCLVDDVTTTGATLSACARALNQAGVKTIVAVTVARAP